MNKEETKKEKKTFANVHTSPETANFIKIAAAIDGVSVGDFVTNEMLQNEKIKKVINLTKKQNE